MAKKKTPASEPSPAPAARAPRKRTAAAVRPKSPNGDARQVAHPDPTHDEIAEAAYHKYLSRRGAGGSDFDDWVEAERDLRSRRPATPKAQ